MCQMARNSRSSPGAPGAGPLPAFLAGDPTGRVERQGRGLGDDTMTLTVHLFAVFREALGPTVEVELPTGATVADLRRDLAGRVPKLAALLERSAVAVNHDF